MNRCRYCYRQICIPLGGLWRLWAGSYAASQTGAAYCPRSPRGNHAP